MLRVIGETSARVNDLKVDAKVVSLHFVTHVLPFVGRKILRLSAHGRHSDTGLTMHDIL